MQPVNKCSRGADQDGCWCASERQGPGAQSIVLYASPHTSVHPSSTAPNHSHPPQWSAPALTGPAGCLRSPYTCGQHSTCAARWCHISRAGRAQSWRILGCQGAQIAPARAGVSRGTESAWRMLGCQKAQSALAATALAPWWPRALRTTAGPSAEGYERLSRPLTSRSCPGRRAAGP